MHFETLQCDTPHTFADIGQVLRALDRLCIKDARLGRLRDSLPGGSIELRQMPEGFTSLVRIIVYQQISVKAADAIWTRLEAHVRDAETVLQVGVVDLCAYGLSAPKARYVMKIAERAFAGDFEFGAMVDLTDDAAREHLMALPGVGPWTAEIYLLSALQRADAFPAGDLALREAAFRALDLPARPTVAQFEILADPWKPWRAAAARLLWSYYRTRLMR